MGAIAVLVAGILWGTTGLTAHYAPAGSSPFAIGAGSMGLGGLVMALVGHAGAARRAPWRPIRTPLAWGVACLTVYPMCFYGAMHYVGITVGTAINIGSAPLMAMAIERATGRAAFTRRKLGSAALAVLGLVLLSIGGAGHGGASNAANPPLGIALGLAAGLTYAGYSASAHEMIRRGCPSGSAMGRMFGVAGLFLVPFYFVTGGPLLTEPRGWAVMAYLALVPMAFAYILFGYGLRTTSASTAVTLTLVEPVVAAVLAVLVVKEEMGMLGWLGMALVLLGVLALGREGQPLPADEEAAAIP